MEQASRRKSMHPDKRHFRDLVSVGPAIARNFEMLQIRGVPQLARQNPQRMYDKLCSLTGQRQDPCVLDVFCAAVAQARDPRLPAEQCQWWYWSRLRKARRAAG
jgi:hypothetical protein